MRHPDAHNYEDNHKMKLIVGTIIIVFMIMGIVLIDGLINCTKQGGILVSAPGRSMVCLKREYEIIRKI